MIKLSFKKDTKHCKVLLLKFKDENDYLDAVKTYKKWIHKKNILSTYKCEVLELVYEPNISKKHSINISIYIRAYNFNEFKSNL